MNNDTKIDIILTVYQGEEYILETIDSILNQTFKNWFLTIVDNGSTDRTSQLIKEKYNDNDKINLIKLDKNIKPAGGWWYGILHTKAELIAITCYDDIWHEKKLEMQYKYLKNNKIDLVHTNIEIIDRNGKLLKNKANDENKSRNAIAFNELETKELSSNFFLKNYIRLSSVLLTRKSI